MKEIIALDQELFFAINRGWANGWFDAVLPWFRNMYFWAPLYILLAAWLVVNFGRKGWIAVGWVLLTFAFTDLLSSSVIKPFFERPRPCNDPYIAEYVRLLVRCGGGFSFTSSHATNHFGFAVITSVILSPYWKRIAFFMLPWAAVIALSQVYVGVHYPVDITVGALLGTAIGLIMGLIYRRFLKLNP